MKNLSEVKSIKEFNLLNDKEEAAYLKEFSEFKKAHSEAYPKGQEITIGVSRAGLIASSDGFIYLELKEGVNTFTKAMKFRPSQLNVMFDRAVGLPASVVLPTLAGCISKGGLKMTVRVVDESDTYTRDDVEEAYTGPQVARIDGTQVEYVPSPEVQTKLAGAYQRIADASIAVMVAGMSAQPTQTIAVAPAPIAEDAEI